MTDKPKIYPKKSRTPTKAIRLFCYECMGMWRTKPRPATSPVLSKMVEECTDPHCPLFEFRFGINPYRSAAIKKRAIDNLRKAQGLPGERSPRDENRRSSADPAKGIGVEREEGN